ncbi:MAG: alpha/beta hydrolase [Tepidisphaeraceae bacterium]
MLHLAHILLIWLYILLPPAALIAIILLAHRGVRPAPTATLAIASSLLLGVAATIIYDLWLGGIIAPGQMLLTCYWTAAVICFVKLLDLIFDGCARLFFATGVGSWKRPHRQAAAQALRVALLFVVGLPYLIVAAATYRPKTLQPTDSPLADLGATRVWFQSTDGLDIAGFWTPAAALADKSVPNPNWGRQTLLICPGSRAGSYLILAKTFLDEGYNVLIFDFRAHGQSAGQIISFGDHERRDVLGAVRWLRDSEPQACRRIVGVGIDTGAAALLAAAADPSQEGRAFTSLAVFGCYDRFDNLADSAAQIDGRPSLQRMVVRMGLALACVQTGADLFDFSPADAAAQFAPRPILFVHGRRDPMIDYERARSLFEAAHAPKSFLWLDDMTDEQAVSDPNVVSRTLQFLDTAVPML